MSELFWGHDSWHGTKHAEKNAVQADREKCASVQGHGLTFRFTGVDAAWEAQSCEYPILKE